MKTTKKIITRKKTTRKKSKTSSRHTNNKKINTTKDNTIKDNTIKDNTIKKYEKEVIEEKVVKFTPHINTCVLINKKQLYILYLYFGVMSKLVNGNIELNTKYNLFYSKNEKNQKMLNYTKSFTLLNKLKCFFYTSDIPSNHNTEILLCNINDSKTNSILICFRIGLAQYYDTTKTLFYYLKKDEVKIGDEITYKPRFYELIIVLSHIKKYIDLNTYQNIMLCGHSRGNTIATYCAYILLILSSDDDILSKLPKHHNVKEFIDKMKDYILDSMTQETILNKKLIDPKVKHNKETYNKLLEELEKLHHFNSICNEILNLKSIKKQIQKKIYVCGTGAYPLLWTNVEDFNVFNDFYLHKYINIISGNKENNTQIYDNYTYYNKFMYIYSKIDTIKNYNTYFTNKNENIEYYQNIKKINYVYKNFGSIILNLVDNNRIQCYKMDNIINKLKNYDKKDKNKNRNYDKNKLLIYHRFEFYRYLFIKYMKFL